MCPFLYVVQPVFFSGGPVDSCHPGCLAGCFCIGVVSNGVAKPGELASFHCCQQGLLLSSKGVHLLSHILVCLMFSRHRYMLHSSKM